MSGSYISLDPTDYNDINDIQSEYDSDDDTDVSMIADNDYSVKTQQAAYFKQIQRKKENVKCLSESELKCIMDQVLSNYSTCGDHI